MGRNVFINLPVKDLEKTMAFFAGLGFTFNQQFTDSKAACMLIGEGSFAMLLTEPFFKGFTTKAIADATTTTEVLIAITCNSKDEVIATVEKAAATGGKAFREPADHGFMLQWAFEDPDGHVWEVFWMDPAHVQ